MMLSYFSISLEEAAKANPDKKVTFRAQVLTVRPIESYKSRSGNDMKYFTLTVGAGNSSVEIRSYQLHTIDQLRNGRSYLFADVSMDTVSPGKITV